MNSKFFCYILLVVMIVSFAWSDSGRQFRKTAVMNGNQVRTVFGNWGVIGQPASGGPRGAWKNDNNGYLGDVSPFVGAEIHWDGKKFHSVASCPVSRPTAHEDVSPSGKYWTFEPVSGYFNPNQGKVAITSDPNSWPSFWPDKTGDPSDPGWRINPDPALSKYASWNGYFGKRISADLETYFVMDDNNDERYNKASNNTIGVSFKPDSTDLSRNGMGLVMRVRAMQWNDFLAKDNIFWLYEITNTGTTDYDKVVFGMLVGTYVGVTSTEDYQEYNDDWSFYDPYENITYTGDYGRVISNPLWVGRVGMVGYAFLESPGNPYDGIDNDGDADSSTVGRSAPQFTEKMFTDSTLITVNSKIIVINEDFSRSIYTVPDVDSIIIPTKGNTTYIYPRKGTYVQEGNVIKDAKNNDIINPNAYDGIDNNYNGLIDENQYIHFRTVKKTNGSPPQILIDIPHVVRYIDYMTGVGTNPMSMIDEKRNDLIDNNNNWNVNYDDVGRDGVANTGDLGEGDAIPTSGYNADGTDSGLPGEPHIDKTDVRESDQIGLTSFFYFTPANKITLSDDESLWNYLQPGYFDVPSTIINNTPVAGEDGDFVYGSGYFPLLAKATERFSLALVYGGGNGGSVADDLKDLLKNKKVVQQIYDANYQFPLPPDKPTLTAVPGDHEVTLYWDRRAEESVDPVLLKKDFEGYKIYKSTDPDFSNSYIITDASGVTQLYKPYAQFDKKDGITGYFQSTSSLFQQTGGLSYYLGDDSGLEHTFVDHEVDNGRRYYYAIVAYDYGSDSIGLFPKENTKFLSVQSDGTILHDINVAVVVPNAPTTGYVPPTDTSQLKHVAGFSDGTVSYEVVDPKALSGHTYRVTFFDSQNDGIDNNNNGIMDGADSSEWTRITSSYNVKDLSVISETILISDTIIVSLQHKNLDSNSVVLKNSQGTTIARSKYTIDTKLGRVRAKSHGSLSDGSYSISYLYYPVWRSTKILNSPYDGETKDANIFDGVQLLFNNVWMTTLDKTNSQWINTPRQYSFNFHSEPLLNNQLHLYRKPSDYEIQFSDSYVDASTANPDWPGILDSLPTKFRIYNVTDSQYVKFYYAPGSTSGTFAKNDQIVFLEKGENGRYVPSWTLFLTDSNFVLDPGSKLEIKTIKPINSSDVFELKTDLPTYDVQKAAESPFKVKVVPNPYVTASSFELPLNPGITSGRGTRKIDFIHVPANASIKIFTSNGVHVRTLYQDGDTNDGAVSWDLKTKENLDVAFGVYFYVVESPSGKQTGKIAIIK